MNLLEFDNAVLIRRLTYHTQTKNLVVCSDLNTIESYNILEKEKLFILRDLWIKVKHLSKLEISHLDQDNLGIQDSYSNYMLNLNGFV